VRSVLVSGAARGLGAAVVVRLRADGFAVEERGGGRIVNIASESAFRGIGATGAHDAASKAGLITLTRRAAAALAGSGVTANAIAPGTLDGETVQAKVEDRHEIRTTFVWYPWILTYELLVRLSRDRRAVGSVARSC